MTRTAGVTTNNHARSTLTRVRKLENEQKETFYVHNNLWENLILPFVDCVDYGCQAISTEEGFFNLIESHITRKVEKRFTAVLMSI